MLSLTLKTGRHRAGAFRLGEAVEAKFKGGSRWFKGKVVSANLDGSYDVKYDDGE